MCIRDRLRGDGGCGCSSRSLATKDTCSRCGTWCSRHFHSATATLPTRLGQRRTSSDPSRNLDPLPPHRYSISSPQANGNRTVRSPSPATATWPLEIPQQDPHAVSYTHLTLPTILRV